MSRKKTEIAELRTEEKEFLNGMMIAFSSYKSKRIISRDTAMKRKSAFLAGLVLLFSGCGQENGGHENGSIDFGSVDVDGNMYLDKAEFCSALEKRSYFDFWDLNGNGTVSSNEYSQRVVQIWDEDESGRLGRIEWSRYSSWFRRTLDFDFWDIDSDNAITALEIETVMEDTDFLARWEQTNDGLSSDEFCSMFFSLADANENGQIVQDEWDPFRRDWLDQES